MITSKQVQDACRGPITYSKIKILMEQVGSRATTKKNLGDILEAFKEIGPLHTQLEEHLQDDEELLDDMMTLADIKLEVNTITGMVQEHLDERASGSNSCSKSQSSSMRSRSPPVIQQENADCQDEFDKQDEENREADEQRSQQAAQLSELSRQKRTPQEQTNEAERQSAVTSKKRDVS
ncbi:Hypothetical predicted protein [Paramuricea clavata]|uniref:Uncharacterized protein n=1 Tax=Paramuricea clavata TaxID=317549 RepID=A0A7D9D8L8_PARCT|nr:Hypothetical predicted protein [Paramuricea clavata]